MGVEERIGEKYKIPELWDTYDIPEKDKIIYEHWFIPINNFHWFISEYNPDEKLAYGYAILKNNFRSKWRYIEVSELNSYGALKDKNWTPRKLFEEEFKAEHFDSPYWSDVFDRNGDKSLPRIKARISQ